jgi:ATP-dependent Clp protease protease subunit
MQTAVAQPAATAATTDEQLATRLLYQRIIVLGTAADVEIYAQQLERTGAMMTWLISKHTGQPEETVRRDSLRDRWFSAEEARDYGIVDHIVERVDDVRPALASRARAGL